MKLQTTLCGILLPLLIPACAFSQYAGWKHSGSLFILTMPEGAALPASASEVDFPLLVRLDREFFDFSQPREHGEDIRFADAAGKPLAYEIEAWDPVAGKACIWVRIPVIKGDQRQEITLYWGKEDAVSESDGRAVFNASNGYLSVWHMNDPVKDAVGTLESKDTGTSPTDGIVGPARHLSGHAGIFGGDKITGYPTGSQPHSSEAWFKAEKPNVHVLAWGNEAAQGKVVMQYHSPPHVQMDCYFSGANVAGKGAVPLSQWVHVVHTYAKGDSRLYVNGVLDGESRTNSSPLAIKSPSRLWIGGWYNNYDFTGDIDEVRISKVARSADWVRLEYENQKPLQTLVGPVVQPGDAFTVSPAQATVAEGKSVTLTGEAGGVQKVYWILKDGGRETLLATDRFHFTFEPGRVTGDRSVTLVFKAICANEVKTREIPVTVKEAVPDPEFALEAPGSWDGRGTIEVVPRVSNADAMRAAGAGDVRYAWNAGEIAVTKEIAPGKLILKRAQNSGPLTVTATLDNGGAAVTRSAVIAVTEPAKDPWVAQAPGEDEMPVDNQFYARDDRNEGTLFCKGALKEGADSAFLRVYADEKLYSDNTVDARAKSYAFMVKLKPGLIKYKAEFGTRVGGRETILHTASNLVCGDAYMIDGQSNAEANDYGKAVNPYTSDWVRSFGSMSGDPAEARLKLWGNAVSYDKHGGKLQVGYWGIELARLLVERQKTPICIINGAVGGTRIDQHQRNPADPEDVTTIYGRLLWRVRQAALTHGIRGVLWHHGENDQGADGPTGTFGWETYRQYFIDMAGAWKQDYPNLQHYYVFQIWPKSCAMGIDGSDNRLREVQRTLPTAFAHMSVMSTLGVEPPGGCHFPPEGYAQFARLICPLVERDNYGVAFNTSITAPDLRRAWFADDRRDQIVMEFDQPMAWDDALAGQFYLDGASGKVAGGLVAENRITLKVTAPSTGGKLTYLDSRSWSQKTLLRGRNGIAALMFCEVPVGSAEPLR